MSLFKEIYRTVKAGLSFGSAMKVQESTKGLHGRFFVKCFEGGSLVHEYVSDNVIVSTASILVASLLKDSASTHGISYLAVGTGGANWNLQSPPAPTTAQWKLEAESFRKAIDLSGETSYVNPETGEPTVSKTNVVDFAVTFNEAEAVGALTEMALFGGDANPVSGSGLMVNYRTFPVINKTSSMSMSIIFRITA